MTDEFLAAHPIEDWPWITWVIGETHAFGGTDDVWSRQHLRATASRLTWSLPETRCGRIVGSQQALAEAPGSEACGTCLRIAKSKARSEAAIR